MLSKRNKDKEISIFQNENQNAKLFIRKML